MKLFLPRPSDFLVEKYDAKSTSFYTFYPAVGHWTESTNTDSYSMAWTELIEKRPTTPLSLYLHFPYCPKQCFFCHCFTIISRNQDDYSRFIDKMLAELDLLITLFERKSFTPNFTELHFGGGSPTAISQTDFDRILVRLSRLLNIHALEEVAIEIDPRFGGGPEALHAYHAKGINRISIGVQDFNKDVGAASNRVNSAEMVEKLLSAEVRRIFKSINLDLIYGLALQTEEKFQYTLDSAIRLNPDRLAVYTMGFRPDLLPQHAALKVKDLPSLRQKVDMSVMAVNTLTSAGYEFIGIDHYAKPTDILTIAKKNGTLFRNAIGYTQGRSVDIIGIGPSAMSTIGNYYFQNHYALPSYFGKIEQGSFPILRGYQASRDDLIRRRIIFDIILYDGLIDKSRVNQDYAIDFEEYFAFELDILREFEIDNLIMQNDHVVSVTDLGRLYQRQLCEVFDRFVHNGMNYKHSREVAESRRARKVN